MESKLSTELLAKDKEYYSYYLENYVAKTGRRINFGTAGFRDQAKYLRHVVFRSGIFASYMARLSKGYVVGVQITASHNPNQDNGVKLIGANGLMMHTDLEKHIDALANTDNLEEAIANLEKAFTQLNGGNPLDHSQPGYVLVGNDTRESSPTLVEILKDAIKLCGSETLHYPDVTTPQLHWQVILFNQEFRQNLPKFDYDVKVLLQRYFDFFGSAFVNAFEVIYAMGLRDRNFKKKVVIDCSNGVGGPHNENFAEQYFNKLFEVTSINTRDNKLLNVDCGSEFVQKERKCPLNLQDHLEKNVPKDYNLDDMSFVSYDGDADRTVFYRVERGTPDADLFEGDKLGALYALFAKTTLSKIMELQAKAKDLVHIKADFSKWVIGAALTAYANGSAQVYYKDTLKVQLRIEPTGVKYLHPAAELFDIGIYFESNGHGTVVFHPHNLEDLKEAKEEIEKVKGKNEDEEKLLLALHQQVSLLYYFLLEANQGVGDAISNFMQIETALAGLGLNATGWKKLYNDLYNANTKIVVKNRFAIKVTYDQAKCTEPTDVQPKIEEICAKYVQARAFIRPSGTEDIIRVYVEATKLEDLKAIQKEIGEYILAHKVIN